MRVAVIGYTGSGKSNLCNRILKHYGKNEEFVMNNTFIDKYVTKSIKEVLVTEGFTLIDTPPLDTYLNIPEQLGKLSADLYIVCISMKLLNINQTLFKIQKLLPNNFIIVVTHSDNDIPISEQVGIEELDRKNWNKKIYNTIMEIIGLYNIDIFYELPDNKGVESNIIFTSLNDEESMKKIIGIIFRNYESYWGLSKKEGYFSQCCMQ